MRRDVLPAGHWVHVDNPDGLLRSCLIMSAGDAAAIDSPYSGSKHSFRVQYNGRTIV